MKSMFYRSRFLSAMALLAGLSYVHAVQPRWIPINGLKVATAKQAGGKGFEIRQTPNGYRLSCRMQAMFAEVTAKGVAIHSTSKGKGRGLLSLSTLLLGREQTMTALPIQAEKIAHENGVVRTIRGDVAEEFTTTGDGIRQDFVINHAPKGSGNLVVEVGVKGAAVTQKGDGILLRLAQSGRKLTYGKLNAADASGRTLPSHFALKPGSSVIEIVVNDANAVYPVRIDPTISDADWSGLGSGINTGFVDQENLGVYALAIDDSGNVYAGGMFDSAGGKIVNNIAKWNPNTSVWSGLGSGLNGSTYALAVDDSGNVYAGGDFDSAGGVSANGIAKWNAKKHLWSGLGGGINAYAGVEALAVDDSGNVYMGGWFDSAGGVSVNNIAKWNSKTSIWSSLGSGVNIDIGSGVYALLLDGSGNLYVGGSFDTAGGVSANYIAKWNTNTGVWSSLGNGVSDACGALAVDDSGNLYADAEIIPFESAQITRWNGSTWDSLCSVSGGGMNAIAFDGSGNLYAAGYFDTAGRMSATGIARWNGSTWDSLGSGISGEAEALAVDNSRHLLYAGGYMGIAKCIINMPQPPTLSLPSNNSINKPTTLTLNWNSVSAVSSYELQVSLTSTFDSTVLDQSGTTSITQTVSALSNGVTYYWRVNASNSTNSSDWSSVWKFTTVFVMPTTPTLLSPSNNSVNQPISLSLSWNNSMNATSYSLQVATSSSFSTTIFSQNGIMSDSLTMTGLAIATTYYWRVDASNAVYTSGWSGVWNFTIGTLPVAPTLSSPAYGATNQPSPVTLSWNSVSGVLSYALQFSTASNFSTTLAQISNVVSTSQSIGGLSSAANYYWRVNETNVIGTSTWSGVWNFTTDTLPAVPLLASPTNGAVNQPLSPLTVSWNSAANATTYSIQVSASSDFTSTIVNQSNLTSTSEIVHNLANDVTYYWRVSAMNSIGTIATNSLGTSAWSDAWSFVTINASPIAPVLSSPTNNAIDQQVTLTLNWVSGGSGGPPTSYGIQVSTVSSFSSFVYNQTGVTSTALAVSGLAASTSYYWHVDAANTLGTSAWSDTWSFMTINSAPGAPVLTSPADNSLQPLPLYLNWSALSSAASYSVQISTVSNFTSLSQDTTVLRNTDYVSELLSGKSYYWRVSASNVLGTSNWSNVWEFTPAPVSVLLSGAPMLEPSCFTDGINLNYTMAQPGAVRISFSDILGREKAAINRQQLSGHYTLSLKSLNLSPGVYLIHFRAGNLEKRMRVMLSR